MHAVALDEAFALQAAVALADQQRFGDAAIGHHLAVEPIAAGRFFQRKARRTQHVVDRVGKTQVVVEGKAQHRQADLSRAIDAVARRGDLRLVVGEQRRRPRQVWIGQQHRGAIAGALRGDGPAVGTAGVPIPVIADPGWLEGGGRREHAGHGGDIEKLHQPVGVGHDIDAGDGQHAFEFGRHMIRVGGEIGVDAGSEAIEIGAHLGRLRLVPGLGSFRRVMGDQIAIERGIVRPPIFRRSRPAFAVHAQQDIAVAGRLCPAEALESGGFTVGINVGDAVTVPQHFIGKSRRGSDQQQREQGRLHRCLTSSDSGCTSRSRQGWIAAIAKAGPCRGWLRAGAPSWPARRAPAGPDNRPRFGQSACGNRLRR